MRDLRLNKGCCPRLAEKPRRRTACINHGRAGRMANLALIPASTPPPPLSIDRPWTRSGSPESGDLGETSFIRVLQLSTSRVATGIRQTELSPSTTLPLRNRSNAWAQHVGYVPHENLFPCPRQKLEARSHLAARHPSHVKASHISAGALCLHCFVLSLSSFFPLRPRCLRGRFDSLASGMLLGRSFLKDIPTCSCTFSLSRTSIRKRLLGGLVLAALRSWAAIVCNATTIALRS